MLQMSIAFIAGIALAATVITTASAGSQPRPVADARVVQLRLYTIDKGRLDDFVTAWHAGVYTLRRKLGYEIPFAAKIPATNQFIWLLTYDGAEPWDNKEAAYYASAERKLLSPDPAQWIARPEHLMVIPIVETRR